MTNHRIEDVGLINLLESLLEIHNEHSGSIYYGNNEMWVANIDNFERRSMLLKWGLEDAISHLKEREYEES